MLSECEFVFRNGSEFEAWINITAMNNTYGISNVLCQDSQERLGHTSFVACVFLI